MLIDAVTAQERLNKFQPPLTLWQKIKKIHTEKPSEHWLETWERLATAKEGKSNAN